LFSDAKAVVRKNGYSYLVMCSMKFVMWKVFGCILILVAIRRFRNLATETESIEGAVKVAFEFSFLGMSIAPFQIEQEISQLLSLVRDIKPKTVVEIGSAKGGTLFLFTRVASPDAALLSIDLPEGRFGGGYPKHMIPLLRSFADKGQSIHLIRADSHSPDTLEKVEKFLDGKKVDFLFIDGDHSYQGVRKDFEMYSPLVRNGGIIAFHDICFGPEESVGGVPRFWSEIRQGRNSRGIVKDAEQDGFGIGVVFVT
jgi:cephalosporin hydroxylase